jgi:hypothetical protein
MWKNLWDYLAYVGRRFQRTGTLFADHFDRKWLRYFLEEAGAGMLGAIIGFVLENITLSPNVLIAGALGAIGWSFIMLVISFLRAPYSLYSEERKEAGKYNWHDIYIKKHFFSRTVPLWVWRMC